MSLSASPRPVGEIAGIRNGLSPPRLLPPRRGPQGSWSRGTPPARLPRDETRAPATLVDAVLYAPADVGSIPTVSIGSVEPNMPRTKIVGSVGCVVVTIEADDPAGGPPAHQRRSWLRRQAIPTAE